MATHTQLHYWALIQSDHCRNETAHFSKVLPSSHKPIIGKNYTKTKKMLPKMKIAKSPTPRMPSMTYHVTITKWRHYPVTGTPFSVCIVEHVRAQVKWHTDKYVFELALSTYREILIEFFLCESVKTEPQARFINLQNKNETFVNSSIRTEETTLS